MGKKRLGFQLIHRRKVDAQNEVVKSVKSRVARASIAADRAVTFKDGEKDGVMDDRENSAEQRLSMPRSADSSQKPGPNQVVNLRVSNQKMDPWRLKGFDFTPGEASTHLSD